MLDYIQHLLNQINFETEEFATYDVRYMYYMNYGSSTAETSRNRNCENGSKIYLKQCLKFISYDPFMSQTDVNIK
jgi:hypothetical protein